MRWELRFFRGVDDDIDIVGRDDGQPLRASQFVTAK